MLTSERAISPNQGSRYQILNRQNALTGKFSKIWATKADIETEMIQKVNGVFNHKHPFTDESLSQLLLCIDILLASILLMVLWVLCWCEVFPLGNKLEVLQML